MATSQEKVHGHDYVDFDEYIDIQLKKTGSTIKMTDVLTAVVGILTLITLYLLLFVIFDHWVITGGFGPATRGIMLAVVGTASCAWFVWKVIVPWRRRVSVLYAASTIEKASPALKSSLLNLVDITRSGHEVSPEIYQSIERRAALALTHVDVNEAVDRRSLLRLSNVLLAVVVLFCLYWIFSPKNPASSLLRAMLPSSGAGVATRTEIFNVRPGDKDVLARSQLEVTADVRGELPAQTFLLFTTADQKFVNERIDMRLENESTRKFRCVITGDNGGGILQNMTYRIVAGDASTPAYKIRVIQAPAATIDSIRLEAPAYTGREPVTQTTGAIDALEGTRVVLKATANMPVRSSASLQCFDDETASRRAEEIPIRVTDGTKLEVEWKLEIRSDGTYPHYYRIFCTNLAGESDPSPSLYSLSIRPDHPPEITLLDPKTDLDLPANAVLPLRIEARDPDFALRYIDLNIEKDGSPVNGPTIYSEGNDQQFKTTYKWSLRDYHFRPKETVTYWLQAKDNRQPIANVARTAKLRIHIVDPVPESQVKKDLEMAEHRQKEAEKAEAARAAQEKQDDDNAVADSSQKRQENEQAKQNPPAGVPNRPSLKHPKRTGLGAQPEEKGQNGEGENGSGDNGQGENGTGKEGSSKKGTGEKGQSKQGTGKTGTEKGTGKEPGKGGTAEGQTGEQESDSGSAGAEKNPDKKLNPEDSADDSKVLQKLLDKQKRDSEQQKNPSDKGEANSGQENQKPEQGQQLSEQKGASQDPKEKNDSGTPSDSAQKQESQKQAGAKQSAEKQAGEKQAGEKQGTEKQAAEKQGAEKQGAEKQGTEKQGTEKQASKGQSAEKKPGQDADRNAGANPAGAKEQPNQQLRPEQQGNVAGEKPGAGNKQGAEKKPVGNKPGEKGTGAGNEKGRLDATRPPQGSESAQERQKNGAAGDSTQPPDGRQKTADGRNEKGQEKPQGKAEPGDQPKEGERNSQSRQERNEKSPGGDSSQSGQKADAKPDEKKPAGIQGASSDGGKENGERQKANSGDAENGKQTGNEKGNDSNQKNDASRNPSNAANRENDQTGEKQPQKNEAGVKERSTKEPGGKGEGQKESADQPNRPENAPSKGGADQNTDGTQKTRRELQSKPNGTKAGPKQGEEDGKTKSDTKEEASAEKANRENGQPTNRGPKKTRNEESTPLKPQPTDEQPNSIRSKKLDPRAGGGESQIGPPADATKEGAEKDAAGQSSSQQNATQQKGASSARKSAAQKETASQEKGTEERPGGSKQGGQKAGEPKNGQANQGEQKSGSQSSGKEGQGQGKEGQGQGQQGNSGQQGSGQDGAGQNGRGKNGQKGQEGQSKDGKGNGNQQESATGQSPTGNGGGVNNGNGPGQGAPLEDTTKQANLDYAKKATDLVLRRLEDQLKRGQVDQKVEEELGWNKEQIRRFVERMRRQAQAAEDPSSPAAEARRLQFEETLKSLNLGGPARSRSTKSVPKVNDAEMESKRSLPSPEYRDWYNAYTRSLAKPERPPAGDKK